MRGIKGNLLVKKFLGVTAAATLLATSLVIPSSVFADESTNTDTSGVALEDKQYIQNEEYYKSLEKQRDAEIAKEEATFQKQRSLIKAASANEYYTIDVYRNVQEYFNFCGPANARQALSFHKYKSGSSYTLPSQTKLGEAMGTFPDKGGTVSTYLADAINGYRDIYNFSKTPYIVGNIAQFSTPAVTLENRVKATLRDQSTAPILLVRTDYLPYYNGEKWRHYETVSGYDKDADQFRLVDTNHHGSYSAIRWVKLGTTNSAKSVARAVYEANLESPNNPVMIW
ncbi:C39 family peptidase [Margalitia sp. FSL K6-0131]|uniref:C39 family peptidase n=1 Tax=Margalitia sp. FSL K6-0131 TaxID=2954604 RepID=UPI0030FCABAD